MNKKLLVAGSAITMLVVFSAAVIAFKHQRAQDAERLAEANRASLVRMHSPTLGRQDAPVVLVEFIDPACETCRAFYPLVKQIMAAHPDKIRLVLRYAPFHNGSDKVVAVLEAARRQDKLWPVLEVLLASQEEWSPHHAPQVGLVWKHLVGLGLNMEQMAFDITAPEIARIIEQDIADAKTLSVTKTPEFFVNGKPMPSFGADQLKALINDELAAAHR